VEKAEEGLARIARGRLFLFQRFLLPLVQLKGEWSCLATHFN